MKLEKPFLIIALVAIVISLPTAYAIGKRTQLLNIERSEKQHLQLEIKSKDDVMRQKDLQLQQEQQKQNELQKQNEELQRKLQAKIQREQYIASLSFSVGGAPADKVGTALAHYMDKGLSKTAAAYLVGNLIAESKLDHTNKTGDGGLAWGLAQWHPNRRHDMPADYMGQLDFVLHEMQRQTPQAYAIVTGNPSPSDMAVAMKIFEGYGVEGGRYLYGQHILSRI